MNANIKNIAMATASAMIGFGIGTNLVAVVREFNELTVKVAERETLLSYDTVDDQMFKDAILDIRSIRDQLKRFKLFPGSKDAVAHCDEVIAEMEKRLSCENY